MPRYRYRRSFLERLLDSLVEAIQELALKVFIVCVGLFLAFAIAAQATSEKVAPSPTPDPACEVGADGYGSDDCAPMNRLR